MSVIGVDCRNSLRPLINQYYRVTQQILDLVDFELDVPPILPSFSTYSVYLSPAQAESGRQWNSQNQSQPNPGPRPALSPCSLMVAVG